MLKFRNVTGGIILAATLFISCSGDHNTSQGSDSIGAIKATNPYRDTFATTSVTGNATTEDNSAAGGAKVVKPHAGQSIATDTISKK